MRQIPIIQHTPFPKGGYLVDQIQFLGYSLPWKAAAVLTKHIPNSHAPLSSLRPGPEEKGHGSCGVHTFLRSPLTEPFLTYTADTVTSPKPNLLLSRTPRP